MNYLFGPVNSRRLGISLGIDLVPFKTCSLNCVFCECGRTTNLTKKITEYISTDEVIAELKDFLSSKPKLDNITFSGSGEPTLNSGIQKIINFLKSNYPEYSISLLTNGTLLSIRSVRRSILGADTVIPSLHAASEEAFNKIARPVNGITTEKVINGLIEFRKEYSGKIYLELFIIPGINDNDSELEKIREACLKIRPDKIQLNSLDRPGTEEWINPATMEKLLDIKIRLHPIVVEIVGELEYTNHGIGSETRSIADAIISTISRRPSTLQDLSVTLGVRIAELKKITGYLLHDEKIEEVNSERGIFYRLKRKESPE